MGLGISFKLEPKTGLPGVNQKKREPCDSLNARLPKKPKPTIFEEDEESSEHCHTAPQTPKRGSLKRETLFRLDIAMSEKKNAAVSAWQKAAQSAGTTSIHLRSGKIIKSTAGTKASSPNASPRSRQSTRHSSVSTTSSPSHSSGTRGTRTTDSLILFWGGPLSNWNMGARFSGQRCVDLLLPRLELLKPTPPYPSRKRFATQLLCAHHFVCGEQWMMACKAWLFETKDYDLAAREWEKLQSGEFDAIRKRLMLGSQPDDIQEKAMWNSSLCRILRAHNPRDQKKLGRLTPNFNEEIWQKASLPIVIAGSIARAEADQDLGQLYEGNKDGTRRFVEGSPYDRIWGVGMSWNDNRIDDPKNWKGENRLGKCHDEACNAFNRRWETATTDGQTEGPAPAGGW